MGMFFVGADHGGVVLKAQVLEWLKHEGHEVEDLGTFATEAVDYPDIAVAVSRKVVSTPGARGVLVCGTGIGMSMAACKVDGIRAAVVTDPFMARMAREHNDANILCLGERVLGLGLAKATFDAWLDASFEGGRHARRVSKIMETEGT
jgi:ribose 5-phosphate isomerase B